MRHFSSTETGTFTIYFQQGKADAESNGKRCDRLSLCDAYAKVIIDGEEVHKTNTVDNNSDPSWVHLPYTSPKINKNSAILIEMWDKDTATPDDLMGRWGPFTPAQLSKMSYLNTPPSLNSVTFRAGWSEDWAQSVKRPSITP